MSWLLLRHCLGMNSFTALNQTLTGVALFAGLASIYSVDTKNTINPLLSRLCCVAVRRSFPELELWKLLMMGGVNCSF